MIFARSRSTWTLLFALLAACPGPSDDGGKDSDSDVVDTLDKPVVRFEDATPDTRDDLVLVVDNAVDGVTYSVVWTQDGTQRSDFNNARTVPAAATARGEVWKATVVGVRGAVESDPASAQVTIGNAPPEVTVTIGPEAPTSATDLVAEVEATDADGDTVDVTFAWTKDTTRTNYTDDTVKAFALAKGQVWVVEVTPTDGTDVGPVATDTVTIQNSPPIVRGLAITPSNPDTNTDVHASFEVVDPDPGDTAFTSDVTWYVDGVAVALPPDPTTLGAAAFRNGQQIFFEVRASDGESWSDVERSSTITVRDNPPTSTGTRLTPSPGSASAPLTCVGEGFFDPDGDPEAWRYTWVIDGVEVAGQTGATLPPSTFHRGNVVSCSAAPWDGAVAGPALFSPDVRIVNAPPSTGNVVLRPTNLQVGVHATVTFDQPADPDGDPVSYRVRWYVDEVLTAQGEGMTSLASGFSVGSHVRAEVIPSDPYEAGSPVSSNTVTVGNARPVVSDVALTPEVLTTDVDLVARVVASDPDGQAVTVEVNWYLNNVYLRTDLVPTGTDAVLPASVFAKGDTVYVTAYALDGQLRSASYTAGPVTVRNKAPTIGSVTLTPTPADERTTLVCEAVDVADADGDPVTRAYRWTVAGRVLTGITGNTLTGMSFRKGDAVVCAITPHDGTVAGAAVSSPTITVVNASPALASATLSNLAPRVNDAPISVIPSGASDPDGDAVTFEYRWLVDGVQRGTSATFNPSLLQPGQALTCEVTPFDGASRGAKVVAGPAIGAGSPPDVVTVTLTPTAPGVVDPIRASVTASDPDGDTLTFTYAWTVDGVPVPGITGATLPAGSAPRGSFVRVAVHADDGKGGTDDLLSDAVEVVNSPPSLTGAHLDPPLVYEDTVVRCVPDGATDPDGDTLTFVYEWFRNGSRVSMQQTVDGSKFDHGDALTCRVKPIDVDTAHPGAAVDAPVVVVENTTPTLASATLSSAAPTERTVLSVVPGSSFDRDGDTLTWRVRWLVDGVQVSTAATLIGADFAKGQRISAFVAPDDGRDVGAEVITNEVVVGNSAPDVLDVELAPGAPKITDAITAVVDASDLDGDALTSTYAWTVGGTVVQTGPSDTLAASFLSQGVSVKASVTVSDGVTTVGPFDSASVIVGNSPPSITDVVVTPSSATEKSTLTCVANGWSDPDGDPPTYQFRWYVNGVLRVGTATITGASFSRGDTVVCKVKPYDGKSFGVELSSTPIVVQNSPPTAVSVRLSTTTPREADTLSVVIDGLEDADGDTVTKTYAWTVDDVVVATSATITGALFDKGGRIKATVTLSDGTASVPYTTAEVTARNTAPIVATVSLSPYAPRVTEDVTATVSASDPDPGDVVTLTYAWSVGAVTRADVAGPVLAAGRFRKHDEIFVTVTGSDGAEFGAAKASATITAINTEPLVASATIDPAAVDKRVSPTCVAGAVTDPDGDPILLFYRWTKNDATVLNSVQLDPSRFRRGDHLRCLVSAYDGDAFGPEASSADLTVGNAPPTTILVALVPNDPRVVDVVQAQLMFDDLDGDLLTWRYAWFVNGVQVSTDSRLDGTRFSRGDQIQLVATPNDGLVDGTPGSSPLTTVRNTAPSVSRVQIEPADFKTDDTISAVVTASDVEGDPISYTYAWYVDDVLVQTGAGATLGGAFFSRGQSVKAVVTARDPYDVGETRESAARTVQNSPPRTPTVKLTPTAPEPGYDDVTCAFATPPSDPDGDALTSYQWTWYWSVDGNPASTTSYGTATSAVMPGTLTFEGELLGCSVRIFDGTAWSNASATASVTISTFVRTSCRDWFNRGAATSGVYELDLDGRHGPSPTYKVDCDMTTESGGWTLVARTNGNSQDFGQNSYDLVNGFAPRGSATGVFDGFHVVNDYSRVMIKAVSGAQAGRYRAFQFPANSGKTLLQVLQGCRDEAVHPNDDSWWNAVSSVSHTNLYTGLGYGSGDLAIYRNDGSSRLASHFYACGVNASSDNDVSYLAFADDRGIYNDWDDLWRGPAQIGTIWSFGNGNYNDTSRHHIGGGTLEALAGWKGTPGLPSGDMHAGTYEIYLR